MAKEQSIDPGILLANSNNPSATTQQLLTKYLENLIQKQEESKIIEDAEREELKEKIIRKQIQMAKAAEISENARKAELVTQARCSHELRNVLGGIRTALVAQRLGEGMFTARCQSCGKHYTKMQEIPPHLYPKSEYIGGPTSY